MKRFFLFLLVSLLLISLVGCGDTSDPVSSAVSTTTTTDTTTTASTSTTTAATTVHMETLRLTVLTPHLTAKTFQQEDGSRYLISLNVADYAPGTILKVAYDGRVMMSFPAQIVAQSIQDTGEIDQALTLIKGKIVDGSLDEGYGFQPDEGGERIYFQNQVQGLLIGTQGTLCLYDYGDQDFTFEGYFYADN